MCFSAPVSLAASALLLPVGLYSLKIVYQQSPRYIPLACIPIAFAIQQACEGLVWLGLQGDSPTEIHRAALGFLAFAYWFWLFWAPWAIAQSLAEPIASTDYHPTAQQMCWGIGWLGLFYGASLYLPLLLQPDWLSIHVISHSIQYETRLIFDPWISQQWARLLYALIVLIPFGLSPSPLLKLMGGAVGLSAILSNWLLHEVFISTWCFFAAVLSLGVLYVCRTAPSSGQNLPCITPGVGVQLRDG